jgi:hypothetical protein
MNATTSVSTKVLVDPASQRVQSASHVDGVNRHVDLRLQEEAQHDLPSQLFCERKIGSIAIRINSDRYSHRRIRSINGADSEIEGSGKS